MKSCKRGPDSNHANPRARRNENKEETAKGEGGGIFCREPREAASQTGVRAPWPGGGAREPRVGTDGVSSVPRQRAGPAVFLHRDVSPIYRAPHSIIHVPGVPSDLRARRFALRRVVPGRHSSPNPLKSGGPAATVGDSCRDAISRVPPPPRPFFLA